MSHDELLKKLTPSMTYSPSLTFGAIPILNSLRAVVELHKQANENGYCEICPDFDYPCQTIQAIEKELA